MSKLNKCDVLIVTYNRINFLKELLDSLLFEISYINKVIIYDDMSTDGTKKYFKEYTGPLNILYIYGKNKSTSVGKSRNIALKDANSEYVMVLDDDDLVSPYKISSSIQTLSETRADWLYGNCIEFNKSADRYVKPKHSFPRIIQGTNNIRWATTFFRTSSLKHIGFNEKVRIITDWLLYCDLTKSGFKCVYLDKCLGFYRLHENSISHKKDILIQDLSSYLNKYKDFNCAQYYHRSIIVNFILKTQRFSALCHLFYNISCFGILKSLRLFILITLNLFRCYHKL